MTENRPIAKLPRALDRREELARALRDRRPIVFLDYDGTLTPIVERPEDARLPERARRALQRLRGRCPVAVVSGRDLDDVRGMVGVDGIWYAGSHGFDILGPRGEPHRRGEEFLPALDRARERLEPLADRIAGVRVEPKRFALAVHWRRAPEASEERIERLVAAVAAAEPGLRMTGGKRIFELRPAVEWDKGRALLWLLEVLDAGGPDALPLYVGDDLTDEDAFRALGARGIGVVVRGEGDRRDTAARYVLDDPGETVDFLEALSELLEG